MQEFKAHSSVLQKTPAYSLLGNLHNMFIRKAAVKDAEIQELLNPPKFEATITDSFNTGKLTKLISYVRNGIQ